MKRIVAGLVIGACLMFASRAQAGTIGVTMGAKYTCSVENCGTDVSRAASPFVAVQQATLAAATVGNYTAMGLGSSPASVGGLGQPGDTLAVRLLPPAAAATPEPASLLLFGTGIAGLVIRRRKNRR